MAYFLDLFSPETYEAFSRSKRDVSGFRISQRRAAAKIHVGDRLVCYLTKLSRWIGVLEVLSEPFEDATPVFLKKDDPFVLRFRVRPIVWLPKEKTVPVKEDGVWDTLSFTKGQSRNSPQWTGKLRSSLNRLSDEDGAFLEDLLKQQDSAGKVYEVSEAEYGKLVGPKRARRKRAVRVVIPEEAKPSEPEEIKPDPEVRESYQIQALLARIGEQMGMQIWLPRGDRGSVLREWKNRSTDVPEVLPLNYDEKTIRTIEQIDVLWLRGRSIVRAFEVEHSTSVYSGILRMADLLALQPNMDIKLHIVAPASRRDKVFQELQRPVFSLLQRGPLSEICTFIPYDKVRELADKEHLRYMTDAVVEEYAERV